MFLSHASARKTLLSSARSWKAAGTMRWKHHSTAKGFPLMPSSLSASLFKMNISFLLLDVAAIYKQPESFISLSLSIFYLLFLFSSSSHFHFWHQLAPEGVFYKGSQSGAWTGPGWRSMYGWAYLPSLSVETGNAETDVILLLQNIKKNMEEKMSPEKRKQPSGV